MMDSPGKEKLHFQTVHEARFVFLLVCIGVFSLTYGFFFVIDFLPEAPESTQDGSTNGTKTENGLVVSPDEESAFGDYGGREAGSPSTTYDEIDTESEETESAVAALSFRAMYPTRIVFDSLDDRSVSVMNPTTRDIASLDAALLNGVVRHPDSGDFERIGTIVLFGHSSYLPNVINKNFQAFNGIQKLAWGDTVRLESETHEYVYRVDRVYEASASDADAEVKVEAGKRKLTLVTCDSFGSKSDRFIVEASLIEERTRTDSE